MNFIAYLDEVARRFLDVIRAQPDAVSMHTDDYGWENHRYSSPSFRMAHVEIFNQDRFMVVHCCVFPHVNDPSPIFGFDVIAGESKVTGLFMDLSPTTFDQTPSFSSLDLSANRQRPDWGRIFSDNWIACRPSADELVGICDMAEHVLKSYLSRLGSRRATGSMIAEMQDRYCLQQRRNEHTVRAIKNLLGQDRADEFITKVLFPTVQPIQPASEAHSRYPALMTPREMETLGRLAARIPRGGIAVECGSALGGSAAVMLDSNRELSQLHLIDSDWKNDCGQLAHELLLYHEHVMHLHDLFPLREHTSSLSFARWYLRDYDNVTMHALDSPYELQGWPGMVDFVFEDSSHMNPQLRDNLRFWWARLKPGGLMSGHDFGVGCRDVDQTVKGMAEEWGCELRTEGTVWWVSKPHLEN